MAVSKSVALEDVAAKLHSMDIAVQLSEWQPAAAAERV
jgi:hypothetical protein